MSEYIKKGTKVNVFFETLPPIRNAALVLYPECHENWSDNTFTLRKEDGKLVYVQHYSIMEEV